MDEGKMKTEIEYVREKLNQEIARISKSEIQLVDLFARGRLDGLLYVRDAIMYDIKKKQLC